MNKKPYIFISLLTPLLLSSCIQKTGNADFSFEKNSPLIFSEFHRGYSTNDRAVELYNNSDIDIDLSKYSVSIYKQSETKAYINIPLQGILPARTTYVIAYDKSSADILTKADQVTPDLMVDGSWPLSLNHGDKVVDVLGRIGYRYDYSQNADIARKKEFLVGREHLNEYDWIIYDADNTNLLGTIDVTMTEEELLLGPKLTEKDFNTPFIKDGVGGGGAIEVTLGHTSDGDTTTFNISTSDLTEDLSRSESVRYFGINTPEIQHGTSIDAQPWGYAAKRYNNEVISGAKRFALQTVAGGSYRETYGRLLAYVWYSNLSNPRPEDYTCMNFMMVREAYAFLYFASVTDNRYTMFYKDVSYINIMKNAETRAKNNGWKIHGEIDPDFNY